MFCFLHDGIQYPVDKRAALGGAVCFGNLDVLVERYAGGYAVEREYFGQGHLHYNEIHERDAVEVPLFGMLFDECPLFFLVQDGVVQ